MQSKNTAVRQKVNTLRLTGLVLFALIQGAVAGEIVTTLDGNVYSNAVISRIEPDGVTYRHSKGVVKISIEHLPASITEEHNLNQADAESYRIARRRAQVAVRSDQLAQNAAELQRQEADLQERKQRIEQQKAESRLLAQRRASAIHVELSVKEVHEDGCVVWILTKNMGPAFVVGLPMLADRQKWSGSIAKIGVHSFMGYNTVAEGSFPTLSRRTVDKYEVVK